MMDTVSTCLVSVSKCWDTSIHNPLCGLSYVEIGLGDQECWCCDGRLALKLGELVGIGAQQLGALDVVPVHFKHML